MSTVDVVVIGAGIVGLATARAIQVRAPETSVMVLDKEDAPAAHQSSHNSGVIHSGIYYRPGSHKADLVRLGRAELVAFCAENDIAVDVCGKVIVATHDGERARLNDLETRATRHGIATRRLDPLALADREPHVRGVQALEVPSAAIVSFPQVCAALVRDLESRGVEIRTGFEVTGITEQPSHVALTSARGDVVIAARLVNCAGLYSDRMAALAGADTGGVRIMAFRGEYLELVPERRHLCRHLVYPVPDPAFPFLGVHLTRMINGDVHAGPNAVPALAREGYRWRDINLKDVSELLGSARTFRLGRKYWRTGAGEIHRSVRTTAFVAALGRLCPEITADDLVPSTAGVRAQASRRDGTLLDDFAFAYTARTVHVINAPSPAATASLAIGHHIASRVLP